MITQIREQVLHVLRVPAAPSPPSGAPGSLRVFRAGLRFYHLRLVVWVLAQTAALAGILFSFAFLKLVKDEVERLRAQPPPAATAPPPGTVIEPATPADGARPSRRNRRQDRGAVAQAAVIARNLPPWVFPLATIVESVVLLGFLASLPFTYAIVRLDYELRWYLVTDRSLRIRQGITRIHEMTMSFASIQQVVVRQNPLQRLLGIADLQVQSAGGGGDAHEGGGTDSLHTGVFHGVDNAVEIRDLILARLRDFREAGLGDPDEARPAAPQASCAAADAARQLLAEARDLRRALAPRSPS
jgi:hypothetical protein